MRIGKNWKFKITPFRILLIIFVLIAVGASLYRFIFGLGSVTNLSDEWPWGLWIGFDLLCGIALARRWLQYCFDRSRPAQGQIPPIARAALLTSLIGYIIALVSLFLDIGRWFNFWRPLLLLGLPLRVI